MLIQDYSRIATQNKETKLKDVLYNNSGILKRVSTRLIHMILLEVVLMYAITKVSSSNQVVIPANFRKYYDIVAGDEISWTNTEEGILLKIEKKVTEEDIIRLIKKELPCNSVEIKKRGSKGLKW